MSRKRTNLDTAEAEYLYANVLVEFSKYESFQDLAIPERNNLVDKVCTDVIRKSCKNEEHIEAVTQEIFSYKLTVEEEKQFYSSSVYTTGLEKPEQFDLLLNNRYKSRIGKLVKEYLRKFKRRTNGTP